jgi:hypothetical protein
VDFSGRFGRDPSGADGLDQGLVVLLVLVRVQLGERRQRAVEDVAAAQVRGDRDPVPGPGVGAGQRGTAQLEDTCIAARAIPDGSPMT